MSNVPHNRLTQGAAEREAVANAAASGRWSCGPLGERFEQELATRVGRRHAVAVGSGLGAVRLALLSLGVGAGDEVIIPAYSCVALANAVLACGARPVLVDVMPLSWTIDPDAVRGAIGPRTKAIIAVHTFGVAADITALASLGPPLIEDCAHGIVLGGMGSRAKLAVTSFFSTKLIGGGEGGAVLADASDVADFVRSWRDYGNQPAHGMRLNDKMTEFAAALAHCQLERLDELLAARRVRAERYGQAFSALQRDRKLRLPAAADRVWYRYAIEFEAMDATDAIGLLGQQGIGAAQPVHDWTNGASAAFSVSARAFRRVVSLPLYPTLTGAEQDQVTRAVFRAVT